jgi:hypothetical protein
MAGRKLKPTVVKKWEGNLGKRKLNTELNPFALPFEFDV